MKRMSIYANPNLRSSGSYFGYAYTFNEISKYLREVKIDGEKLQVDLNSPKSKIQLCYGTPPGSFYNHQYKIQMTQWESTIIPPSWVDLAKGYDEYWTANDFGKNAFVASGVPEEKVHVFEHGVDAKTWRPFKRGNSDAVRFLHIDSGSPRKRGSFTKDAFVAAFGNNLDYEMTFKYSHHALSDANWFDPCTLSSRGDWETPNIRHIYENLTLEHLVELFHYHDVLIYPSEGEGFGLIPLQALATGMPVISTSRWCSYEDLLHGNVIDSSLGVSPIVETYTRYGDVVLPDFDSTVQLMRASAQNIKEQSDFFYNQIHTVASRYDWLSLCQKAVDGLRARVGDEMFDSYTEYLA